MMICSQRQGGKEMIIDIWKWLRGLVDGLDDFENFMILLVIILFSLLLIRSCVALYMGSWSLFGT